MKKLVMIFLISVLLVGIALAVENETQNNTSNTTNTTAHNNTREKNKTNQGIGQNLSQMIAEKKAEIKAGNYTGPQGQLLQVREMVRGLKELRTDSRSAKTDLNITIETDENNQTKIRVSLKNGSEREIKIMPDTAADKAIERLNLKVCNETNNCTIVLKEVGQDSNKTAAYELQVQRHYKILGLFKAKALNKAEVDADTGNITITKKPWWAFLAKEQD